MNLDRKKIRALILEELLNSEEPTSEMQQFSESKSGQKVIKAGEKIKGAGKSIHELALDQTGRMRETLGNVSKFVYKVGNALSEINNLEEGTNVADMLPTTQELKKLYKEIQNLEKM
jgi:hypothetical protein